MSIFNSLKLNWKAGITVSLISIPLSISLAVASNATPAMGIITAIWAGLFAAIFGGSKFNIVGPTGALSGVIASYVIVHGLGALPVITVLAGLIIFLSYLFKLERFLILIPASVIHGFTLGVALIIALGQFNAAFGITNLTAHESFIKNLIDSLSHLGQISIPTVFIFIVFLIGLLLFKKFLPKLPGAIVLAPFGIILGYLTSIGQIPLNIQTLGDKFGTIQFHLFQLSYPSFSFDMLSVASVIASIAILETLLSAKIADAMTKTKYNERKEMLGLALANIASGLAGGLPATAALARTSLNIKSGATSKVSSVINVMGILLVSLFFIGYFRFIPMAVIAAILVYVAIQMVEIEHFSKLYKYEKEGFIVSLLVALLVVLEDPIVGILFGVAVSLLIYVNRISKGLYEIRENVLVDDMKSKELKENPEILLYSFKGRVVYINAKAHLSRFENNFIKYKVIMLRFREVYFLDLDGIETIDEIINICQSRGQKIILTSIPDEISKILEEGSFHYRTLKAQKLIFPKTEKALTFLNVPLTDYKK